MGHLHLAINHGPIVGLVFSIALLCYAYYVKSDQVKTAALWAYIVVGLSAAVSYLTGESAEELVEHMPGVTENVIHRHEEAAAVAMAILLILAVMAGSALYLARKHKHLNAKLMTGVLVFSVLALFPTVRASNFGGQIRHTEIRSPGKIRNGQPGIEAGEESGGEGGEEEETEGTGMPEPANK